MNYGSIMNDIRSPYDGCMALCVAVVALALKDARSAGSNRESALKFLNGDWIGFYEPFISKELIGEVRASLNDRRGLRKRSKGKTLEEEWKVLLENYSTHTCRELGEMLGLSQVNVYNRLRQMGLRAKKCTHECLSELHSRPRRKMYEKLSDTKRRFYE